jgi:outer membrane protein TolC
MTLEDCLELAMEGSPLILSAQEQYQASLARVRQATALPQPSLDIDSDLQPEVSDFSGYGERYVGISQTIPFPVRTYLDRQMAQAEANGILSDVELVREEISFQVKEAFFRLLLAQEKVEYATQNLELTQDFQVMTEMKLAAGDVAQVEVVRARVEVATATNDLRKAQNEVRLARSGLNVALGRRASTPLEIEGQLRIPLVSYDLDQLTDWALAYRPEVLSLEFATRREENAKRQGYTSYFPDFDIGAAKHRIRGEGETWDVTLSLTIPLFFWQPVRGEIAEAESNLRALREDAVHMANAVSLEVEEAFVALQATADEIRLFEEEILTQSEEAYRMYQFSYEQGEGGGMELIQARRTLNDARTSYADALFNYDVARASVEKSVGRRLEEQRDGADQMELELGDPDTSDPVLRRLRRRIQLRNRGGGGW